MVQFSCATCEISLEDQKMFKHLSQTKHTTVIYTPSGEQVECEKCHDSNIHVLTLIRYGGTDMGLLCQVCFAKEERKPSTRYTIQNGSILENLKNYLRLRDLSCFLCSFEKHLNIHTTNSTLVFCSKCIKKEKLDQANFVNEKDENFLDILLGIKTSSSFASSKKPSGKSSSSGPELGSSKKKTSKSANGHASSSKPKRADKISKKNKGNAHGSVSQVTDSLARLQVNSSSSISKKPDKKKRSKKDSKSSKRSSDNEKNDDQFKILDDLTEEGKDPNYESPTPAQGDPIEEKNNKVTEKPSEKPSEKKSDQKPSEKPSEKKSDQKPSEKPKEKSKTNQTQTSSASNIESSKKELEQTGFEDYEEFEHVPKFLGKRPKLSYGSLNKYFRDMCYHLYLEEELATNSITNFKIEWDTDNKRMFKLTIPYTEEIEKLVSERLRQRGKSQPFRKNQSFFLTRTNDKDNIWSSFIKKTNVIRTRGSGNIESIELVLVLYKWNNTNNFQISLSILPCSVQISRILFAMSRIENPKFIEMLLGKTPIRQLKFNDRRITFTTDHFNTSQKSAIQHVLNNSISVLQGPPGTGKTSTIHELILQLLKNLKTFPILVVAGSNVAVDNIAEKLKKDTDINILRIVSAMKESEYNDKHHLQDICLHNQVFAELPLKHQETAKDLRLNRTVSQSQYKGLMVFQNFLRGKITRKAQVILTTSVAAGGYQLKSVKKLPVVIMDESTQSNEASTLIPLSMPGVKRFVFVGDDKQLSSFSDVPYLEQSLFERVLKNGTYTNPHMLNIQYRMHPSISEFPSKKFYNNLLEDGVTDEQRRIPGIEPLTFIHYGSTFREKKVGNPRRVGGFTYNNKKEAALILRVLKDMIFVKNIKKENISIITPYSAQRDLIATLIQKDSLVNPTNEPIAEEVDEDTLTIKKPTTIKTIVNIMISSIDAFQGREKDIIIFSCVRCNKNNKIGFVKDARRLNVALTRARSGLVIVGNKNSMSKGDPLWKDLVDHLEEKKFVRIFKDYFAK